MLDQIGQKRPVPLVVGILAIIALLAGAVYMMNRADARLSSVDAIPADPIMPVDVYEIRPLDVPRTITARGLLSGIEEVTVSSEAPGRIVGRTVPEGTRVSAGDVLLRVDDTFHSLHFQRASAELAAAQAQLDEAGSAVKQAQAQLESAKAIRANRAEEYERIESLHQSGNAPQIEYDRTVAAFRTAEADLAAATAAVDRAVEQQAMAEAKVKIATAAKEEASAQLERCVVRSPLDGIVNRFFVERGEYAVATAPLVEVVRLNQMKMVVELPGPDLRLLDELTDAQVVADAVPERPYAASLRHVSPKVAPTSRQFPVELLVDNEDGALRAGMYATVTLRCGVVADRLVVPREAVFKHFGADYVLVATDEGGVERARLRRISMDELYGRLDDVQISSGVGEGESVIVTQRRGLRDGVRVQIARTVSAESLLADAPATPSP